MARLNWERQRLRVHPDVVGRTTSREVKLKARHPGRCLVCRQSILVGEPIRKHWEGWAHRGC